MENSTVRVTCHSTGTEHSVYHQYTQAGLSIQTPMQQLLNYLSGHQDCFKFNWLLFSLKQIDVHNAASAWMFFFCLESCAGQNGYAKREICCNLYQHSYFTQKQSVTWTVIFSSGCLHFKPSKETACACPCN